MPRLNPSPAPCSPICAVFQQHMAHSKGLPDAFSSSTDYVISGQNFVTSLSLNFLFSNLERCYDGTGQMIIATFFVTTTGPMIKWVGVAGMLHAAALSGEG